MSRLYPVTYGAGVLLLPDFGHSLMDDRVVRPTRPRKESRRARV
jgi:hypothetical protein